MARFRRVDVYNAMYRMGVIPLFYHSEYEVAKQVVQALYEGGARVIEYTNRGDNAGEVFGKLCQQFARAYDDLILGVGSVLDAPTAAIYIMNGANFIVGSVLNPEVAKLCNRRKIAYIPGCGSATEISLAEELGVEVVKIFPADTLGGPRFVKSILGPTPWTSVLPSGGVEPTRESIGAWFQAGAKVLGMGSNLVRKEWIEQGNFDAITELMREVLLYIAESQV